MKIYKLIFLVVVFLLITITIYYIVDKTFISDSGTAGGEPEYSSVKEKSIKEYNLEQEKKLSENREPCDVIAFKQYLLELYPAGSYLLNFEEILTGEINKDAVIYYNSDGKQYIFAVIAHSKESERYVEMKNLVGYESSFINLDSTKLGTAFIYLNLFKCENDKFTQIWESEVPAHGGFSSISVKRWRPKNTLYVELNFDDGIISGHRNFNYFLIDGIENPPHLMETYLGLVHKRKMANINNDNFPDYLEYRFAQDSLRITEIDSIPFYWSEQRQLYITDRNRRWFRKY
ncbi:MAG: hypothetical protein JW995_01210 [Melioribacteraceae bacterium]|nr:hypothetical protein [Melioribacteraceae bacterium]